MRRRYLWENGLASIDKMKSIMYFFCFTPTETKWSVRPNLGRSDQNKKLPMIHFHRKLTFHFYFSIHHFVIANLEVKVIVWELMKFQIGVS